MLLPPALPLLVAVAGLWLARRRPAFGRTLVVGGVALTWLMATPVVADRLASGVEAGQRPLEASVWQAERAGPSPPGAIVVLGGGSVPNADGVPGEDRLSPRSLQRAHAAARLARATGLPVLATGGRPAGGRESEATLLRRTLQDDLGVAVRWVEEGSRDTAENAVRSVPVLHEAGIARVVLVTHAFHMRRARAAFEAAGIAVLPAPHDPLVGPPAAPLPLRLLPSADAAATTSLAIHEWLGLAWLRLAGPPSVGGR